MAQTLEALTHSAQTLDSIRGIVHTMKTLSAINAVPYDHAAEAIEAYHQVVLDGFRAFVHRNGPIELSTRADTVQVMVVFGSDHGLCGGYNETLATTVVGQWQGRGNRGKAPTPSLHRRQNGGCLVSAGIAARTCLVAACINRGDWSAGGCVGRAAG